MVINKIELKNFYPLRKIGGDFVKEFNHNYISIKGTNGIGKSFILSNLTPFYYSLRNEDFVPYDEDKEMIKRVHFTLNDKNYISEINYSQKKAYLYVKSEKNIKLIEDTQSGNINSYERYIEELLGISRDYLSKTFYMNEFLLNILNLSPKERRELLTKQINELEHSIYNKNFNFYKEKENEAKAILNERTRKYNEFIKENSDIQTNVSFKEIEKKEKDLLKKKEELEEYVKSLTSKFKEKVVIEKDLKFNEKEKERLLQIINSTNIEQLKEQLKKVEKFLSDYEDVKIIDTGHLADEIELLEDYSNIPLKDKSVDFEKLIALNQEYIKLNQSKIQLQNQINNLENNLKTKKENLSFKIRALEEFELEKIRDKKEELERETNKLEIDNKYSIEAKKMFIYNPELIVKDYIEDYDLSVKNFYFSIKEHNKPLYKRVELYYESYEDIINNKLKELQSLIQKEKEINEKVKNLCLKLKNFEKETNKQKNGLNEEYKQIEKRLKTIKNAYENLIIVDTTNNEDEVRVLISENKNFKKINQIVKKYNLNTIKAIIKAINKKIKEIEKTNEKNANLIEEKIRKSNEKYILDNKIEQYKKAKKELVDIEIKIKEYEQKLNELEIPDFNEISKKEAEIKNEISNIEKLKKFITLKNDIKEIEERVFVYNKMKNFSKRIQEQLVEEYFKSIMEVANYILQSDKSNISKMQLELKVTKSILEFYIKDEKGTKRKLTTLSGGESIIVSKAISTAIALATKNNFNILLLDESDSKLTDENKFIFNEYIKKVLDLNINQIFIISHSNFIKGDENVFLVEK